MGPASGFIQRLTETSSDPVNFSDSFQLMGHSALLGLGLMLLTAWVTSNSSNKADKADREAGSPADLIYSSANVLYLSFGMTGMMLIVNNNIARAFAIAAAIALVRFRIKVDTKILSMSLFYGVLTGMACGVGHVLVAYILVLFFGLLQILVLMAVKVVEHRVKKPATVRELKSPEVKS